MQNRKKRSKNRKILLAILIVLALIITSGCKTTTSSKTATSISLPSFALDRPTTPVYTAYPESATIDEKFKNDAVNLSNFMASIKSYSLYADAWEEYYKKYVYKYTGV